jgi:hypothetical protein
MSNSQATAGHSAKPTQLNIAIDPSLKQQLKLYAIQHQMPLHKFSEHLLKQGISQLNGTLGQEIVRKDSSVPVESQE